MQQSIILNGSTRDYISNLKLTAGFKYLYHCSIHDYISNLRLDVTNTNF